MKNTINLFLIFIFTFISISSFGQADSTQQKKKIIKADSLEIKEGKHGNLVAYLYELQQLSGVETIKHIDSTSGYSIVIPNWWKIRETPNNSLFGGTFPEVNKVQNALLFKAFNKTDYKNLKKFEAWVISNYKLGDIPKWSRNHKILLKQEIDDFKNIGNSYKVQLMWNGSIYYCCYIIVETSKSFLWIDFTATNDTYDINFPKLKELLKKYKTL